MSTDFGRHRLVPHPDSDAAVHGLVKDLSVDVTRLNGKLVLLYRLTADPETLKLPEPRPPARTDGLWRHTCFEAFIRQQGATEYWEYNFSPSGAWAAYHFTAYREGMAPLMKGAPPMLRLHTGKEHLQLEVTVDLSWLARSPASSGLELGVSAVIEDRAQALSYWAIKHPPGKPDFHHADGFAIDLG